MNKLFKIIAQISIKKKGGRTKPVYSGYRPGFCFIENRQTTGSINLIKNNSLNPGDTEIVEVFFVSNELLGKIKEGTKFNFYEGNILIGNGEVVNIIGWIEKISDEGTAT
jgi:translation elongation factor EF-Tu-like GTPase